ncbi:HNH endonuclease [Actinomyces oris]|uniref:HNH endonuclease n=1 Tax=Actinomyces oris TaxID=544580 RepID=UPI003D1643F6
MGRSDAGRTCTAARRGPRAHTREENTMTTSRTGTTRWLRNAATAKRSARAAGLEHCPICHVRLTWDAGLLPSSPEADHIVPHSRGGNDSLENIQIICRKCNQKKGNGRKPRSPKQKRNRPARIRQTTDTETW